MWDEARILAGLQAKRPEALEAAIETYTPYLSAVLYNAVGRSLSREDMEEIAADTFMLLWERAGRIEANKGGLRAYMAAIARNAALKRIKRARPSLPLEEAERKAVDSDAEEGVLARELWQSVMGLGEPDSEIFVRHYKYGEKLRDIAKACALPLSTVKSKLARGKEKLRKVLAETEAAV